MTRKPWLFKAGDEWSSYGATRLRCSKKETVPNLEHEVLDEFTVKAQAYVSLGMDPEI